MAGIELSNPIGGVGAGRILPFAGAPGAGTDEVQTITIDATGGTFKLKLDGHRTADISWSATNNTLIANIDAALEALPNIGTGGVTTAVGTMTAGVGTATVTFAGANVSKRPISLMTVVDNALTGTGTCTVEETTPGVAAAFRSAQLGTLINDVTNLKTYIRTGTTAAPTNTVLGTQS
jgi:hypothetical protein